ncbi:hypothetical protein LSM04_007286 [Trypanosoma melophagium]|uniref:uncharacterized protein n=1 Tax=Trypanosoma melophagium TaxID=715481 RepID=UPI00351A40BD|nr:hypothetical protein LSM04_007286 [Trypanosoma melophagium]
MMTLVAQLVQYPHWTIAEEAVATYNDEDYDIICFTDASADGWGAIVVMNPPATPQSETITDDRWTPHRTIYQQRWIQDLDPRSKLRPLQGPQLGSRGEGTRQVPQSGDTFNARHSANAEPRAIHLPLRHLERQGVLVPGESLDHKGTNNNGVTLNTNTDVTRNGPQRRPVRVAVVIDHFPIAHAQRRPNGFGGIGLGYALNRLFEYTNGLFHAKAVQVVFFYIAGPCNPADRCSRKFGPARGGGAMAAAERSLLWKTAPRRAPSEKTQTQRSPARNAAMQTSPSRRFRGGVWEKKGLGEGGRRKPDRCQNPRLKPTAPPPPGPLGSGNANKPYSGKSPGMASPKRRPFRAPRGFQTTAKPTPHPHKPF